MRRSFLQGLALALWPMVVGAQVAVGGSFELRKGGVSGGGATSTGGTFVLRGAIGRADASPVNQTNSLVFSSGPLGRPNAIGLIFRDGFE